MVEITFDGVKKFMDSTLVLKNITFMITDGEKVGIVGENGSGKTTILKLIAGILKLNHCPGYPYAPVPPGYDEGWVKITKGTVCAYLEQIPQYAGNMKVIDVLNLCFSEVHQIESEMRGLEEKMQYASDTELKKVYAKYNELVQIYEVKGGYEVDEKLSKICKGLKFSNSFLNQDFNNLSGGEKTIVVLGKLLIETPDVLLLDEPTNHLDMESIEWLEGYIRNYKGIVIVVSHDRYFMDNAVNKVIDIEDMECETYRGNYSEFTRQKEDNLLNQFNNYKLQQKKINAMEQTIKDLKDWAKRGGNDKFFRRAASMQIRLDKMARIDRPVFDKTNIKLNIKASERSGRMVIKASDLSKSFEKKTILRKAELLIQYGEKVALIGPNGSGKTTFIKMLFGEIYPDNGEISLGASIRMVYLPQNITFENEELTVLEYFREDITILEGKAREQLAKFMFYGGNVFKKVRHLSGGEKVRLKLSKLLFENANLLILDEPTNHLDTASIESIEAALSDFKGTVFFISHDRYFINKICERIVAIEGLKFTSYHGNYDFYKREKEKKTAVELQSISPSSVKIEQSQEKNRKQNNTNNRIEKTGKSNSDLAHLELRMKTVEDEIKGIESAMEAAGSDYEGLNRLYLRKTELNRELDSILHEWVN